MNERECLCEDCLICVEHYRSALEKIASLTEGYQTMERLEVARAALKEKRGSNAPSS